MGSLLPVRRIDSRAGSVLGGAMAARFTTTRNRRVHIEPLAQFSSQTVGEDFAPWFTTGTGRKRNAIGSTWRSGRVWMKLSRTGKSEASHRGMSIAQLHVRAAVYSTSMSCTCDMFRCCVASSKSVSVTLLTRIQQTRFSDSVQSMFDRWLPIPSFQSTIRTSRDKLISPPAMGLSTQTESCIPEPRPRRPPS